MKNDINAISVPANMILNTMLLILSVVCVFPLILVLIVSFSSEESIITNGFTLFPTEWTLDAYKTLFKDSEKIIRGYSITIFNTVVGTILTLIITSMYAFSLSRREMAGRGYFAFFIYFTMLFNGGLVPFYLTYSSLGLKNTLAALIMPLLLSAFNVLIMRTFFLNTVPDEVYESARVDGAGDFRIYLQIVMPISLPVLATIGLFQMIAYWNEWFLSMIFISNDKLVTLQYLMVKVMNSIDYLASGRVAVEYRSEIMRTLPTESVRMAMAIIGMGPIVLFYPFLQKYFVRGLTVGAVKG